MKIVGYSRQLPYINSSMNIMNPFSVAEAFLSGTVGGTSYPSIDVRIGSQGIADDRRHVDLMN